MVSLGRKIAIGSAVSSLVGVVGISGWGSQYLGPQDVQEALYGYGLRALGTQDGDDAKWEEIIKKGPVGDKGSYLSLAVSKANPQAASGTKTKLDEIKEECGKLLKTGRSNSDFWNHFKDVKNYCSVSIQ